MIVLNAGVPRSGTVLVNAILRQIYLRAGRRIGQSNPQGPFLPKLIRRLRDTGEDRSRTTLVHTHSWDEETAALLAEVAPLVGFACYRDPRDVAVSLMRLHDHALSTAVATTLHGFRAFEAVMRDRRVMAIPYELLVSEKRSHIFQIGRRLGFWLGLDVVVAIDRDTSADRHARLMEQVRAGTLPALVHRQGMNRVVVEDRETLINDRHIQSGAVGRWRSELTPEQQVDANERFAEIIRRYGYPV